MKRLALTAALLAATALYAAAPTAANYAGKWTLDQTKSQNLPHFYSRVKSQTLNVTQSDAALDVAVEVTQGEQAPDKLAFHYTLDGKETKTETSIRTVSGPVATPAYLKAIVQDAGALALTIDRVLPGADGRHVKTNERWSLSADGKTLTVQRTDDGPLGTRESQMVFVRQ
jgi:hypothetical protein